MFDGPILASGIHRLKDQKNCPAVLRVEHILQFGECLDPFMQHLLRLRLVISLQPRSVVGINVLEPKSFAIRNTILIRQLPCTLDEVFEFHLVNVNPGSTGLSPASLKFILFVASSVTWPTIAGCSSCFRIKTSSAIVYTPSNA